MGAEAAILDVGRSYYEGWFSCRFTRSPKATIRVPTTMSPAGRDIRRKRRSGCAMSWVPLRHHFPTGKMTGYPLGWSRPVNGRLATPDAPFGHWTALYRHSECVGARRPPFLSDLLKALTDIATAIERARCALDEASHDPLLLFCRKTSTGFDGHNISFDMRNECAAPHA